MAHITGGGIPGNLPRIMPEGICAGIRNGSWPIPRIFSLIEDMGKVPPEDMKRTFNMGIGFAMIVPGSAGPDAINMLRRSGYPAYLIGNTEKGSRGVRYS
jgi:phosphoribosylformylglycinamidine cyclo-ligase